MQIKSVLRVLFFSLFFFGQISVFCQVPVVKSSNKVSIEGRIYLIHIVKPGQTLYSISKAYEISEQEIIRENPGADKVMQAGQALKIPLVPAGPEAVSEFPQLSEKPGFIVYEVQEKETAYSIAKRHQTTVLEIEHANPGIDYTHLSIGQKIYIPQAVQDTTAYITHKVKRRENIYRITRRYDITETELKLHNPELRTASPQPGQVLRIPVRKEKALVHTQPVEVQQPSDTIPDSTLTDALHEYEIKPEFAGRPINVAYLIPFDFNPPENDSVPADNLLYFSRREFENTGSQSYLEFFEGSLLGIEELGNKGISLDVKFIDTKRSPENLRALINSGQLDNVDLIIGPFNSFNVSIASYFSREKRIPLVSPFYAGDELTVDNPYLFQMSPSVRTEFEQYAAYIRTFPGANVVIIRSNDSIQAENLPWIENLKKNISQDNDSVEIKDLVYSKINKNFISEISRSLSRTRQNIVFIPENDEVAIPLGTVVTQLFYLQKNFDIRLVGMPSWTNFQSTDYSYLHSLGFTYLTPYYFSYDSTDVKKFLKSFTSNFYAEPSSFTRKGCPYAFQGYDLTLFFVNSIYQHGRNLFRQIGNNESEQLMDDFHFEKISIGGYENRSFTLVRFLPDLSVTAEKFYPVDTGQAIHSTSH